jgi:hypothetical protein
MPGGTNDAKDVHILMDIPVGGDGTAVMMKRSMSGPWGAPTSSGSVAREALGHTAALLDVLQKALREGQLTECGIEDVEWLQRFYVALKCQIDQPGR